MLAFLRSLARKLQSTWTAFTSAWVSRERVKCNQGALYSTASDESPKDERVGRRTAGDRSGAPDRGGECVRDSGPTPHGASDQPLHRPGDGRWRVYALRDRRDGNEPREEDMLDADGQLPRGFFFKTRAEAEAYRLARPGIHDAYIHDHVSGAFVPPLHSYFEVHWAPGKEPTSWPPTPDDYEAARRYAMRDWPPHTGSPYEWVEPTGPEKHHVN